jgi:hypothetical protein
MRLYGLSNAGGASRLATNRLSGHKKTEEGHSCECLSSAASSLPGPTHTTKSQKENFQVVCWIIPLRYRPKLRGLRPLRWEPYSEQSR